MGGGMMNPILVVIGNRRGDSLLLEQLPAREVRYLDPNRAQNEYGIRANGGAIVVKLMNDKEERPGWGPAVTNCRLAPGPAPAGVSR
jgi:hypothetical protein